MFCISQNGKDRLDISLSGKLDAEQMKVALNNLMDQSAGIENGLMLYDLVNFQLPSLGAVAIEISRLPAMFSLIKRFRRAAVLTDKNWIRRISELEGKLFPDLEIRGFSRAQRAEAEQWLNLKPPIL
jgi:hypothetical protein